MAHIPGQKVNINTAVSKGHENPYVKEKAILAVARVVEEVDLVARKHSLRALSSWRIGIDDSGAVCLRRARGLPSSFALSACRETNARGALSAGNAFTHPMESSMLTLGRH